VLRIFIALKNPSPCPGSKPQPLVPVTSTPPRQPTKKVSAVGKIRKFWIDNQPCFFSAMFSYQPARGFTVGNHVTSFCYKPYTVVSKTLGTSRWLQNIHQWPGLKNHGALFVRPAYTSNFTRMALLRLLLRYVISRCYTVHTMTELQQRSIYLPTAGRNCMTHRRALEDFPDTSQVSLYKTRWSNVCCERWWKDVCTRTHPLCRLDRLEFTRRSYSWGSPKISFRMFSFSSLLRCGGSFCRHCPSNYPINKSRIR
jgi:hypothetical protein